MYQTLNKFDAARQVAVTTKVPKLNKFRSIISSSKIPHQLWCDDTFNQRNKARK